MDFGVAFFVALSFAALSSVRAFAPSLVAACLLLAERGVSPESEPLVGAGMLVLLTLASVEFFADKIPTADHMMDAVGLLVRPLMGALTAVLVSGPSNAQSFTLNADGSFTYTPTAGFTGTDTFTYKANDGSADSNVATATIIVTASPAIPAPTMFTLRPERLVGAAVERCGVVVINEAPASAAPLLLSPPPSAPGPSGPREGPPRSERAGAARRVGAGPKPTAARRRVARRASPVPPLLESPPHERTGAPIFI